MGRLSASDIVDRKARDGQRGADNLLAAMRATERLDCQALGQALWLMSHGAIDWDWYVPKEGYSRAQRGEYFDDEVLEAWPNATPAQVANARTAFMIHVDRHEAARALRAA